MLPKAHVFIATSLDGFIATPDGAVDWLTALPVSPGEDHGYSAFIAGMDAMVMGANTFRVVRGFGAWSYTLPVHVLSRSLGTKDLPQDARTAGVRLDRGTPRQVLERLGAEGARNVYVDGGRVVSSFLREGLIARLTITRVPVLLGRGLPLFADTGAHVLHHVETRSWDNGFVQSSYATEAPQVAR